MRQSRGQLSPVGWTDKAQMVLLTLGPGSLGTAGIQGEDARAAAPALWGGGDGNGVLYTPLFPDSVTLKALETTPHSAITLDFRPPFSLEDPLPPS